MFASAARAWGEAFSAGLEPDPELLVSAWAAEHIRLPSDVSARPGPWDNDLLPFGREIMDVLSPSDPTERVVLMKSAQVGGTALATNWLLFIACAAPGPAMVVQPSIDLAAAFSAEKLGPTIDSSPIAKARVVEQKSRDGGSRTRFKRFRGGFLILTGANSAAGLRQRSIRYLLKDDLDGWPDEVDGEGDPSDLAEKRTQTYWNKKILEISTPTVKGISKIERSFEASDKRFFMVECPHCLEAQRLVWENVQWEPGRPETARYYCAGCGTGIEHRHKPAMLAGGRWVATSPGAGKAAGFHVSELYSPFTSWAAMAAAYEASEGDPKARKVFVNTALGETYEEAGEAPPWIDLFERAKLYRAGTVPRPVCFLTAGADVQGDRIEVEIVGWAPGEVSYSIDYRIFYGTTADPEAECWRRLAALYDEPFTDDRGLALKLEMLAIDAGYNTNTVQRFTRGRMRAIAIKGVDGWNKPVLGRPRTVQFKQNGRTIKRGDRYFPVGTWPAKREIYERLRLDPPADGRSLPPGFCLFPAEYPEEYFKGLTAEVMTTDAIRGFDRLRWRKTGRNEPLDCRVYAVAAAYSAGMDKLTAAAWAALEAARGNSRPPDQRDMADLWAPSLGAQAGPSADPEEEIEIEEEEAPARPVPRPPVAGRGRGIRGRVSV